MTTNNTVKPTASRSHGLTGRAWTEANATQPHASRRRSIPHLLVGIVLVLACAGGSLLILAHSNDRQPVLVLARPVQAGQVLTAQDLREVDVAAGPGLSALDVAQAGRIIGQTMSASLPAGVLITPQLLADNATPPAGSAIAALPLRPGQVPPQLSPGTRVWIVLVPAQNSDDVADPDSAGGSRVWQALVASVVPAVQDQGTVVSVQMQSQDAEQVAAIPAGQLSLVIRGDR